MHISDEKFDNHLTNHFVAKFQRKHKKNISKNAKSLEEIKNYVRTYQEGFALYLSNDD